MKTKLLILAVLTSGYLTAQITVNSSHFFNVGDNYTRGESTTLTTNDSPGANKTWSYASLDTNDGIEVYTYLNPSTTTSGSQFPSANIAEEESYNSYFEFYNKTATNLDFVGIDEGGDLLIFSNPATFYSFPIAYGNNHFDTFEAKQVVVGDVEILGDEIQPLRTVLQNLDSRFHPVIGRTAIAFKGIWPRGGVSLRAAAWAAGEAKARPGWA